MSCGFDGDDLSLRDDVLDERDERCREDDRAPRRPLEDDSARNGRSRWSRCSWVIEDAVDAVGGERERRRRDEPILVRAHPRIDDEARAPTSIRNPAWPSHVSRPAGRWPDHARRLEREQYYDMNDRASSLPPAEPLRRLSGAGAAREPHRLVARVACPVGALPVLGGDDLGQLLDRGLVRALVEHDAAVAEQVDAVAHLEHVHVVVGDHDHRDVAVLPQLLDQLDDQRPLAGAHRRERLVEQEDLRVRMRRARDRDRLALTARHARDLRVDRRHAHADVVEVLERALLHHPVREKADRPDAARDLAVQEHVVVDGHPGHEREVLEDGVDPERAGMRDGLQLHLLAEDEDLARRPACGSRSGSSRASTSRRRCRRSARAPRPGGRGARRPRALSPRRSSC